MLKQFEKHDIYSSKNYAKTVYSKPNNYYLAYIIMIMYPLINPISRMSSALDSGAKSQKCGTENAVCEPENSANAEFLPLPPTPPSRAALIDSSLL
jgi:hypothetical protein